MLRPLFYFNNIIMDSNFWNERYISKEYAYGKEPNFFFRNFITQKLQPPGKLLLPAEGEGRNAVFAASQGYQVTAFDFSTDGKNKALLLAEEKKVTIDYQISSIQSFDYVPETYDLVGLFFVHQSPQIRPAFHYRVIQSLKTGGMICLEAFHIDQINLTSGGPKSMDMLMHLEQLSEDFKDLEIIHLAKTQRDLDEGSFHQGMAALVQLIAIKK
jgi:hypothetical protein